jgi:hypothetical protein
MAAPAKRSRKPAHGRNRQAVEDMVAALRAKGQMDAVDAARLVAAQALADAVDSEPTNASLWREYRAALETLRQAGDNGTDEFAALLAGLSAEVGDSSGSRAENTRARG